jgi:hypothetical protein
MKFKQLCDSVANLTNRPDFVGEIKLAVQHSTLKLHSLDFFPKDREILTYQFSNANSPAIDLSGIARLRRVKTVYAQQQNSAPQALQELQFSDLIDFGGKHKTGYVLNKNVLTVHLRNVTALMLEAYVLPDVSPENYSSWIADLYPFAIIHNAVAMVYADLGDIQQSQRYQLLVGDLTNPRGLARPGTHIHTILAEQLYSYEP